MIWDSVELGPKGLGRGDIEFVKWYAANNVDSKYKKQKQI